jgi:hypothetical protein
VFLPWLSDLDLWNFRTRYRGEIVEVRPYPEEWVCGPQLKLERATVLRYGERPSPAMVYGYDAANLVIIALRAGAEGRIGLRQRLAGLSGTVGASGVIEWDNGGGNTARPAIRVVDPNGR